MSLEKMSDTRVSFSKVLSKVIADNYSKSIISSDKYENGSFCDFFGGFRQLSTNDYRDIEKSLEALTSCFYKVYSISGLSHPEHKDAQRISVLVYPNKEELEEKIRFFEEAKLSDHSLIGAELELFFIDSHNMPGTVNWLPKGTILLNRVKDLISKTMESEGYQQIITPFVAKKTLWEVSGHWDMFKKNMFIFQDEDDIFAIKPMSCPAHIGVFKKGNKSYRDLPYKLCEFGLCTRNESSGALDRLFRLRSFTQDDAHVFCSYEQIEQVVSTFIKMLKEIYSNFGFEEISVCLSTRPEVFHGTPEQWEVSENVLASVAKKSNLDFKIEEGDGAFYGPKLDFNIKDKRGRLWQCGTVQLDFFLAERFAAQYSDSDGSRKAPVIVHHAILGSLERFIAIFIENCSGSFPFWLSPVQISILPINEKINEYAKKLKMILIENGFSCEIDLRDERISHKIANAHSKKIPVSLILGKSELESESVSMRIMGQEGPKNLPIQDMLSLIRDLKVNRK